MGVSYKKLGDLDSVKKFKPLKSLPSSKLSSGLAEKQLLSSNCGSSRTLQTPLPLQRESNWGLLVSVVYNKFSGPASKLRSAWQRKISSEITTQGPRLFIQNNEFVSIHANHLTQKGVY